VVLVVAFFLVMLAHELAAGTGVATGAPLIAGKAEERVLLASAPTPGD
jgi:hypothetical protein